MQRIIRPCKDWSNDELLNSRWINYSRSNVYIEAEIRGLVNPPEDKASKTDAYKVLSNLIRQCRLDAAFWDKLDNAEFTERALIDLERAENALKALTGVLMIVPE